MITRLTDRLSASVQSRAALHDDPEAGMSTAEYAIGTVAACALAGILMSVINSGEVKSLLSKIIVGAFKVLR